MEPFLARLPKDADLTRAVLDLCRDHGVTKASLQIIGALQKAVIGYYHQAEQRYENITLDNHYEILAAVGNLSILDGEPMAHLHLTLADSQGRAFGGHAQEGCIIFAAEACVTPISGPDLVRGPDEATGLKLWT